MADVISDLVHRWTTPPLLYVLIGLIVLIAIVVIFLYFIRGKKKLDHFKGESIEYVVKELNLKKQFGSFSRKCDKGKIYYSLGSESVRRVMNVRVIVEDNENKTLTKEKKEFVAFKTGSFLSEIPILSWLFKSNYFMIDNGSTYIIKDQYSDTWTIKPEVYVYRYAEVWVCSKYSEALLTEMTYKRQSENDREIQMNMGKRVVFYNDIYAYKISTNIINTELESEKYDKQVSRETGVGKK